MANNVQSLNKFHNKIGSRNRKGRKIKNMFTVNKRTYTCLVAVLFD